MSHLSCTVEDDLATLVLHNAPQNRLGVQMTTELDAALRQVETSGARAVLLRADGADFSFGGDIEPWPEWSDRELRSRFQTFMEVFNRFERIPVPTITAVQGCASAVASSWPCAATWSSPGRARRSAIPSSRSPS